MVPGQRRTRTGVPLPSFACEPQCLHGAWQPTMPSDSHTAYAGDLQATAIHLEAVPRFFEAKAAEAIFPFESGIARLLTCFHTTEERLKGFIEVLHNRWQDMTMDRTSTRIAGFIGLDLSQLFVLADGALLSAIGFFACSKARIVPAATRFKCAIQTRCWLLEGYRR
jgi:hypothetical protein